MLVEQNTAHGISVVCSIPVPPVAPNQYSVSKAGGGLVGPSGSITWEQPGTASSPYVAHIALQLGDTDTLGDLLIVVEDANGNAIGYAHLQVVPWNPENAANLGLTNLDAPVSTVVTNLGTVLIDLGTVLTDLGTLATAVTNVPNATLDQSNGVDSALTPRQALRLIVAALAGKISISGVMVTIRDTADAKNRIVATVDGTGQRTAISYDKT